MLASTGALTYIILSRQIDFITMPQLSAYGLVISQVQIKFSSDSAKVSIHLISMNHPSEKSMD